MIKRSKKRIRNNIKKKLLLNYKKVNHEINLKTKEIKSLLLIFIRLEE